MLAAHLKGERGIAKVTNLARRLRESFFLITLREANSSSNLGRMQTDVSGVFSISVEMIGATAKAIERGEDRRQEARRCVRRVARFHLTAMARFNN